MNNTWDLTLDDDDSLDAEDVNEPAPEEQYFRIAAPLPPSAIIDSATLPPGPNVGPSGRRIVRGKTVELRNGSFLRVASIIQNFKTDEVTLRGWLFRRNRCRQPMMPRKLNEVYMEADIDHDDPRPFAISSQVDVKLSEAVRTRVLFVTDEKFPLRSFRDEDPKRWRYYVPFSSIMPGAEEKRRQIFDSSPLVCRRVLTDIFRQGERKRKRKLPYVGFLRPIHKTESDDCGGYFSGLTGVEIKAGHYDRSDEEATTQPPPGTYTLGDGFCCAGGVSCAARFASIVPKWGFDQDPIACESYKSNFPGANVFNVSADKFPPPDFNARVDILHVSPPCQPYSPAHTTPGKNDDVNKDSILSVGVLVNKIKPRIVTLEETFGLLNKNDECNAYFQEVISMFTREEYAVRWAVLSLKEYGVPQTRTRLIIIAAAPGQPFPDFPAPTHGPDRRHDYATVYQYVGDLPEGISDHSVAEASTRGANNPCDKDGQLGTVVTAGARLGHWSDNRGFTPRELACLQTFPRTYRFTGTNRKRMEQIGNAVPPVFFEAILRQLVKALWAFDEKERADKKRAEEELAEEKRAEEKRAEEERAWSPKRRRVSSPTLSPAPLNRTNRMIGSSPYDPEVLD
ncbi:S-adenosyl-L-methionine-dependent methyltransferase [Saccharata proteae CBS 121410]|uniref:DNA (cytosine-5-)-methyltransferase n=1 Tax=Saccharata proteae CBS 121410 TaxID=1314787 RepID=A0A9P4HNS8_9PEZI|nr:S-adenosyl-L-methionine-dependent methyltransferase [Saccharata proteae CBS 121410]